MSSSIYQSNSNSRIRQQSFSTPQPEPIIIGANAIKLGIAILPNNTRGCITDTAENIDKLYNSCNEKLQDGDVIRVLVVNDSLQAVTFQGGTNIQKGVDNMQVSASGSRLLYFIKCDGDKFKIY